MSSHSSFCDTAEGSTGSPSHSRSRTSDLEIHWRSPYVRLHAADKEAVLLGSDPGPLETVRDDDVDSAHTT